MRAPRITRFLPRRALSTVPPSISLVRSLAANLRSAADVEDLVMTWGAPNPSLAPAGPVRPLVVVKVGGEVITKDLPALVSSLRFLRDFGLLPVVVHGGGPQLNDELAKAGVAPQYIGGHRVTDAPTMKVAQRVFEGANHELAAGLRAAGLPAAQFLGGVFRAEVARPELGLVGEIRRVDAAGVDAAIARGEIPVLTSVGLSGEGAPLNINADVAARELAIALQPMRVVFISAGGGWKEEGAVIDELNMARDYARFAARDYTGRQGTLLKLNEMKCITDALPAASSVTITSAAALGAQLLPQKGPGTQIRAGAALTRFDSPGAADAGRLAALLDATGAGAVAALLRGATVYATADYSAAAVVLPAAAGAPPTLPRRLAALVATAPALAAGAEGALWAALRADFPRLRWLAPPSMSPAAGAAALNAAGPCNTAPLVFPPLSETRSGAWAEGSVALGQKGRGMWWGAAAAGDVAAVVEALAADAEVVGVGAAAAAAAAAPPPPPAPRPVAPGDSGRRGVRLGLLGARGFVGREFLRLVAGHPSLTVACASSRALVGQGVAAALGVPEAAAALSDPLLAFSDVGPEQLAAGAHPPVDAWVLALPNGLCAAHAAAIEAGAAKRGEARAPLMLDLSADMRFCASGGRGPGGWAYGLPERPGARAALAAARRIANPGCYATGAQLALLPLLAGAGGPFAWDAAHKPHVFGVSGYSGAGTTPSDKNDPDRLRDNLMAYSLVNHIHEREVGWHCGLGARTGGEKGAGAGGVAFMPHVAPFFQGIHLTVTGHLAPGGGTPSADAIAARFAEFYAGERLVQVLGKDTPDVARHGSGKQGVTLGGFTYDPATRRVALVSCIDNLLKGAATQALQNINLAMGAFGKAPPSSLPRPTLPLRTHPRVLTTFPTFPFHLTHKRRRPPRV